MRKLVTSTFVTLDGIMQAPGGPGEDDSGGFNRGGWSVNYWDDIVDQAMDKVFAKRPELLLGRKTYEIFAAYWPNADEPGADDLNNAKKYVVSRTLDKVDWNNSTLIKGDVVKEITRLKELDAPELQVHGSSNLIQTLLKHDLIDEMHLVIFPVVIGKGKRFFGEGTHPSSFKLVNSKTSSTGVIIATYERSGELKAGTFA
ncbi:MAG: dihydrofolate reductase family protein [Anaerolineae bacterium]|jgi:dihydrofolate reductase